MKKHVAIIGGGIAGMETAMNIAKAGHRVTVLERTDRMGGHVGNWNHLFPDFSSPDEVVSELDANLSKVDVNVVLKTEVTSITKSNGRFAIVAGRDMQIQADAVVVSSGFNLFDATHKEEYGYGIFDNVITSADLEGIIKEKKKLTTSQGTPPKRIAIIHCVGSRDAKSGNTYCSKVCCITGVKQAIEINKLLPNCEVFCFYMDLRLYGSNFDDLYLMAQKEHRIQFVRGRLSEAAEKPDKSLQIKAEDTLSGRPLRMNVDMIVLLVGMEPGESTLSIANNGIQTDVNGFFKSKNMHTARNHSTVEGVFLAGACICPMSINETLENSRSAAVEVVRYLERD